jgi:tetratricopeptide (TPR) repeat protein
MPRGDAGEGTSVAAAKGGSSKEGRIGQVASSAVTDDRLRRRVIALAAMWLLFAGLLAALSLVLVVVAALALMVVVAAGAGAVWALRRLRLRAALGAAARSTTAAGAATARAAAASSRSAVATSRVAKSHLPKPRIREHASEWGSRARTTAAAAPGRTEALAARAFEGSISGMYRLGVLKLHSVDPGQRAQELNQIGAQLRRDGEPEQAAERHRAALEIVRDLGDQQAEAMTLNNLGLALAHSGAGDAAVEHLEQAVGVLRELGDEEHEGRVIANLGIVYRRQGNSEEATHLFQEALEKLEPASPAYRQVEEELSRAS